jgi:3-deoxy-D-manno-octulosonate 8-phosphate phosphatase (KDO 8-P phosphatase)
MQANIPLEDYFHGDFITSPVTLKQKLKQIKAFVFDWDGVFNDGRKNIEGHSSFSEVDSMGINMMRFSYHLLNRRLPITAIISGENNQLAFSFSKRENFHSNYYKVANKEKAFQHFCSQYNMSPADVLFVYDDILDLPVAKLAGVRFMVGRRLVNPLFIEFAKENRLVDYITKHDGATYALREISEIVMALSNNFPLALDHRMKFSEAYQTYLSEKGKTETQFFTIKDNAIIQS